MGQPVQQGSRHAFALEDLAPLTEGQVAGEQQTGPFIPIREDLEQEFGPGPTERQIAQLIADQQIHPVELSQEAVQLVLLLRFLQTSDQRGRRVEPDSPARAAGGQTQGNRQVRLADSGTPQEAEVLVLIQPLATSQFHHLLLGQVRHQAEVVAVEVLIDRERRLLDPRLQGVGTTLCRFQFHQT